MLYSLMYSSQATGDISDQDLVEILNIARHKNETHEITGMLLYQDGTAQLWGRAAMYDDATSNNYLPPELRRISDETIASSEPWPALPVTYPGLASAGPATIKPQL